MTGSATPTITTQALKDALIGGLLSVTGSWSVHLGTTSPAITPSSVIGDFLDPFFPEYQIAIWTPTPLTVDLEYVVHATGASLSFSPPSQMPQQLYTVWVTYTASSGQVQLLEAWYLPSAPVPFGPGGLALVLNVGYQNGAC